MIYLVPCLSCAHWCLRSDVLHPIHNSRAPAEILDLRVHCDRMRQHAYNNFEVVNMDIFRTDAFWRYFSEFDRTAGFFCGCKV